MSAATAGLGAACEAEPAHRREGAHLTTSLSIRRWDSLRSGYSYRLVGNTGLLADGPTAFHQVVAIQCLSPSTAAGTRARYLAAGGLLVVLQTYVLATILFGSFSPPCSNIRRQCPVGLWCPYQSHRIRARCASCARSTNTIESFNATLYCAPDFCAKRQCTRKALKDYVIGVDDDVRHNALLLERMCQTCLVEGVSGTGLEFVYFHTAAIDALHLMGPGDWVALFFSIGLVTVEIAHEQRDVLLCQVLRRHLGHAYGYTGGFIWLGLAVVEEVRYACSLLLNLTVCGLILYRGSDALNICLTSLAVLFVLDADDILYQSGFSEGSRNSHKAILKDASITLRDVDASRLDAAQRVQFVLVPLLSIFTLLLFGCNANQIVDHACITAVLCVVPPALEIAFSVHGGETSGSVTVRRVIGVLLVALIASLETFVFGGSGSFFPIRPAASFF